MMKFFKRATIVFGDLLPGDLVIFYALDEKRCNGMNLVIACDCKKIDKHYHCEILWLCLWTGWAGSPPLRSLYKVDVAPNSVLHAEVVRYV